MRRVAQWIAWAVVAAGVLLLVALASPALLLYELAFGYDDPADSYRRF